MNKEDKIPKWFIIFLVAMLAVMFYLVEDSFGYGIVDRTATRDTLSIPFQFLDTLGEAVDGAANDSVYIVVFSPGGAVVFKDSMVYTDASIKSYNWEDFAGGIHYAYMERVSVLDGASTADGVFSYHLVASDNSLGLQTQFYGQFQIVNSTLDGSLDSAAFAQKAVDSINALLDTIQLWDTRIDSMEAALADANLAKKIWDTDIDATLKSLVISNSAGDAVQLTGGGGGSGLNATGAGSGNGIRATGGLTASGIWAQGGATNGSGINAKAGAGSNQHGLSLSGDGAGYDLYMKNDGGGLTTDTLNAIIDSLQNQDNWVARSSHADSLMDSVQYNIIQSTNAAVDVANINGWSPITDNDSLIVDQSSLEDMVNTLTAAEIADTISNRDSSMYLDGYWHKIANRADSGAFFLGDGGYSVSVQLYDTTISQIIAGATIAVRNLSQSSLVAISTSDNNGLASFNLNADSFLMVASSPGYLFNPYDTVIITGSSTDTVYGAQFNPGTPVSPNLCRVFGYLYDLNGSPDQEATVTAFLPAGVVRYDSLIISPYKVTSTTDSAGYFYLDLIPTDSLIPSGVSYEFTISRKDGTILRQRLTVPDTSNWRLVW